MSYFDTIYADTLLPHRAIPVYMYLKDRSGSTGSCWPGIKTIAKDLNLSRIDGIEVTQLRPFVEPRVGS